MSPNSQDEGLEQGYKTNDDQHKRVNAFTRFHKSITLGRRMKKRREGNLLETLEGHVGGINCMTLSVDESILITGSEDNTARVWIIGDDEIADGESCLGVLEGHTGYITCVAIFDRYVYTGSSDATIRKWDIATCECVYVYEGHGSKIHKLLVTEDLVFSTSHDKTARVWFSDPEEHHDKGIIRTFRGHGQAVHPLVYLPYQEPESDSSDEEEDEEEEEGEQRPKTAPQCRRREEDIINRDDLLVTGSADSSIKIWNLLSGECLRTLRNHTSSIIAIAADPTGKVLYSCGADSFIKYWDVKTGAQIKSINAHRTAIVSMAINHRLMYTGSQDGTARCWVTEFGDNTVTYKVITGSGDGIIRCFDAKSGHLLRTFSGHEGAVLAIIIANDKIFSATTDGAIRVFQIDWKFIKAYLAVLCKDVEVVLGHEAEYFSDEEPDSSDNEEPSEIEVAEDNTADVTEVEVEEELAEEDLEEKLDEDEEKDEEDKNEEDDDNQDESKDEEGQKDEDKEDEGDDQANDSSPEENPAGNDDTN